MSRDYKLYMSNDGLQLVWVLNSEQDRSTVRELDRKRFTWGPPYIVRSCYLLALTDADKYLTEMGDKVS